jgi:hypothetical protein
MDENRGKLVLDVGEGLVRLFRQECEERAISQAELGRELLYGRYEPERQYVARQKVTGRGVKVRKTFTVDEETAGVLDAIVESQGENLGDVLRGILVTGEIEVAIKAA